MNDRTAAGLPTLVFLPVAQLSAADYKLRHRVRASPGAIRKEQLASALGPTMRCTFAVTLAILAFTFSMLAQDDLTTFRTETTSAFVWGENNRPGTVSSSIQDPVTGNLIRTLNHAGVEVSSRAGFEKVRPGEAGELLSFATTIVNNTESAISVRQGAASVDGRVALPLPVVLTKKGLSKKERKQVWELPRMNCFSSGFLPNDSFLYSNNSSKSFTVAPKQALTVSFVTKDPRYYSVLCSMQGCYPKGTIRFSLTVNATDFVFVWPGGAMFDCGR